MKPAGGLPIGLQDPQPKPGSGVVHVVFGHLHPRPIGQELHRIDIIQVLDPLDEGDDVAARAAAEAIEGGGFRVDGEGGGFFSVKGAKPHQIAAPPLDVDIGGDHALDIAATEQFLQKAVRQGHGHAGDQRGVLPDAGGTGHRFLCPSPVDP